MMWLFRRKNPQKESQHSGPSCSHCGSTNTRLIIYHGTDHPDYIRTWRGQRSLTYRCLDCGRDFYGDEPQPEIIDELISEEQVIDDEDALHYAEEEIKRQTDEDDDRRYGP